MSNKNEQKQLETGLIQDHVTCPHCNEVYGEDVNRTIPYNY